MYNGVNHAVPVADVHEKATKARETFIAMRTREEQKVERWHRHLMESPQEKILSRIPFDYTNLSTRTEIPEWYKDVPDLNVCKEQVAALNEKLQTIHNILSEINGEAEAALEEYNKLYYGGK